MASLIQTLQHALDSKDSLLPLETKRILLKEVLQAYVLDLIYNHPKYRRLNFYGGTCLHIVYELNRLSEDLDFDNGAGVDLTSLPDDLIGLFRKSLGYDPVEIKSQRGENDILRVTIKLPVLNELGLSPYRNEALHLKVEVSHHRQIAVLQNTPVFFLGRSFVPSHFSLETMMAGKMIACLERNFQRGREGAFIKGRDYYDLLWFMQKGVHPLEEKLARDGEKSYTTQSAMLALKDKIAGISVSDLAVDLLPMFESGSFIESWLQNFHVNFERYAKNFMKA
ncbi:MAG: nucleotidyl transferase AbiEii/AbiGii toxin family protein [Anaerolineales bacterium]|nr:nucleotidyl transferase AbiEii/AbiGii toxin family protein [Anaerolineales bacterium]